MGIRLFAPLFLLALTTGGALAQTATPYQPSLKDSYEWLVPLKTPKVTRWLETQNSKVGTAFLKDPRYAIFKKEAYDVLTAIDGLGPGVLRGKWFYTVDKSGTREHGVWQRIPYDALLSGDNSLWETLLDLDVLSTQEKKSWTFKQASCLGPKYERCLVLLSDGGSDVASLREFEISTKTFVKGGFQYKVADTQMQWLDANRILIASDFGPQTVTTGGWPLQVRLWKRGQAIEKAKIVFDAKVPGTTGAFLEPYDETPTDLQIVGEWVSFREVVYYVFQNGRFSLKLDLPVDCTIREVRNGTAFFTLLGDWSTPGKKFPQGSILTLDLRQVLKGGTPLPQLLYTPSKKEVVLSLTASRTALWVLTLDDLNGKLWKFSKSGGKWKQEKVKLPDGGTLELLAVARDADDLIARFETFLTPEKFYGFKNGRLNPKPFLKAKPDFDSNKFTTERKTALSADGTKVPYFLIRPKAAKKNSQTPTLLWGYGAGNISYSAFYLGIIGKTWLKRGGAFAFAVLRGGGELGPDWRRGGYRENKPNTFADFEAVAQNLEKLKFTNAKHLGIYGGSWGGLLVTASFIQKPKLFGAVAAEAPMTDMLNYTLFRSGWAGEFGDPGDPQYTKILRSYSPYHNVQKQTAYPDVLFTSATNDDRMHPAHARRMVAKMQEQGHNAYYFEAPEGGHGGSTNEGEAESLALRFTFFAKKLGLH